MADDWRQREDVIAAGTSCPMIDCGALTLAYKSIGNGGRDDTDPRLNHGILDEFQKLGYPVFSQNTLPLDEDLLEGLFGEEVRAWGAPAYITQCSTRATSLALPHNPDFAKIAEGAGGARTSCAST